MKKILFPTDFSDNANNALQYTLSLASEFGAEVMVLNTYELPYSHSGMIVSITDVMKKDSENGLKRTEEWIAQQSAFKNVKYETKSIMGNTVDTITDEAVAMKADLVVMGTKGASGIQEALIGSNTSGVIHESECPVLAIPEEVSFKKPSKIAFAADLERIKNKEALQMLKTLSSKFDSEIQILNIIEDDDDPAQKAEEGTHLDDLFQGINHSFKFETSKDVADGIQKFTNENNIDILAVLSRKHNIIERVFHKSITNAMAFHTKVPLLALQELD